MEFQDLMLVGPTAIGFISMCSLLFPFITWLYKMFLRTPKDLLGYGSWAVITGSTDGIGKALALELASKGHNLVCVGRNPAKLESTAAEIHRKFGTGISIRNVTLDFSKSGPEEILSAMEHGIQGADVGLLINNVGIAYSYPRFLHETKQELIDAMIKVNIEAMLWVTMAVIPGMIKKKKGAIVNIGSGSSATASSFPLNALYASSKAFMATFSRSISLEYQDYGIDVQCQAPLFVLTNMTSKIFGASTLVPTAETFSRSSVKWIGHDHFCCPSWSHSLQSYIATSLPDALVTWCIFQFFLRARQAALDKINKRR